MFRNPDHVTVVVTNLEEAVCFFELLGFELLIKNLLSGEKASRYLQVDNVKADHFTMVLKECSPKFEIQLLHYRNPKVESNPSIQDLSRPGYNHLCLKVDNLKDTLEYLSKHGLKPRSGILEYQNKKLAFLLGPENITVELAE
ncbi:glyoxalase [Microbulbifer sp. A4B17]|uniref:VOC family protein n=1 Tax=Microbulbifer sp. A4B17 TaxID=359370 RepID=UPI000D52D71A|nr:VOC family protein [Microbulbifer sp. A4B17]AWF83268.1 glyoxalase [Microbulbifer sp. A4B17]